MNPEREWLCSQFDQMKPGQEIEVVAHIFERAYPSGFPSIYRNAREAFLSSRVGAAWGCWTCELHPHKDCYRIGRHEEGKQRVYVDPDREHLFDRLPSGELVPKNRACP